MAVWATASAAAPSVADKPHTAILMSWLVLAGWVLMGRAGGCSWRFCWRRTESGRCLSVDDWKSVKVLMAILTRETDKSVVLVF